MNQKKKILFVDDDNDLRDFFSRALNIAGYEMICADNGDSAIEILKQGLHLDLAVIDFMMPHTTGWELINYIREETVYKKMPIIVFTGLLASTEALDKIRNECFAILEKGDFELSAFIEIVKKAIESGEKTKEA